MNLEYTAAVIGLGKIGASYPSEGVPRTHTAAYLNHPKVNLVAAIDPNTQARDKFRSQWGGEIKLFSSVEDMFSSGVYPEIVSICTKPEVLQINLQDLIKQPPKILFLEKPTVSTREQSDQILKITGDIPTAINYHRCWDPKLQTFFDNLSDKKILTVRVLYTKGLLNYATHIIALLISNLGEVISVAKISNEKEDVTLVDQSYQFILHFKKGFNVLFQGFDNINYDLLETDFITESGIYSLKSGGCRQRYEKPVDNAYYPNYRSLTDSKLEIEDAQVEGLPQAVENIVDYLDDKVDKLQCDLKCGLEVYKIIEKVRDLYRT